jgi:monoamine oxidase
VRGGNDLIVSRLAEPLQDVIETTTVLEAIRTQSDGSFLCSFRKGSSSLDVRANDVVLTIPFTMLRDVRMDVPMQPVKQRAIGELGYGTNAKLMVGFTERVWRERWGSNGSVLTDLSFQQVWETSRKQAGASGILTNFTGGRHGVELGQGTATSQATTLVSQLLQVFPGIAIARTDAREARMHWPSNPFVRGSYACYRPGQWTALRGAEAEPVGRLYFAGEHCSLVAQGFMEGACETGLAAARQILAARGTQPAPRPSRSRRALLGLNG